MRSILLYLGIIVVVIFLSLQVLINTLDLNASTCILFICSWLRAVSIRIVLNLGYY